MWVNREAYILLRQELARLQTALSLTTDIMDAKDRRVQEVKDEVDFWKKRSRDEREQKERAVDVTFQTRYQHPGIQKDPEEVFQRQQESQDTMFDEKREILEAQHVHMEKHGPDSLLREELSGFSEPDDGIDRLSE